MNTQAPCGRAFAQTGAVTLDNNTISNDCIGPGDLGSGRGDSGSAGFGGIASGVPEPGSVTLLGMGLLGLVLCGWRSRKQAA